MRTRIWAAAIAAAALMATTGCAAGAATAGSGVSETHVMPDGTVMEGSEHGDHTGSAHHSEGGSGESAHGSSGDEPSEAARMVCSGQVVDAVTALFGLEGTITPGSSWVAPDFTCTYDIDGAPLVLTVNDAADEAEGEEHFTALRESHPDAETITGMEGLGMPAFRTPGGIVAFVRDGKTLTVDASALEAASAPRSTTESAYAVASAVLVCWTHHD